MQSRRLDMSQNAADRRRYRLYLFPLGAALLWHIATVCGVMSWQTLDAPAASLWAARTVLMSGALAHQTAVALLRIGLGLAAGILTGATLAILARPDDNLVRVPLQMLRPLPFLALAPLVVLLSGTTHALTIAAIALNVACPIYFLLFAKLHVGRGLCT